MCGNIKIRFIKHHLNSLKLKQNYGDGMLKRKEACGL